MPSITEVQKLAEWIFSSYGAVNSILIFFVLYLVYQLRSEQKESRETRSQMATALEQSTQVQISFARALTDQQLTLNNLYNKIKELTK